MKRGEKREEKEKEGGKRSKGRGGGKGEKRGPSPGSCAGTLRPARRPGAPQEPPGPLPRRPLPWPWPPDLNALAGQTQRWPFCQQVQGFDATHSQAWTFWNRGCRQRGLTLSGLGWVDRSPGLRAPPPPPASCSEARLTRSAASVCHSPILSTASPGPCPSAPSHRVCHP